MNGRLSDKKVKRELKTVNKSKKFSLKFNENFGVNEIPAKVSCFEHVFFFSILYNLLRTNISMTNMLAMLPIWERHTNC